MSENLVYGDADPANAEGKIPAEQIGCIHQVIRLVLRIVNGEIKGEGLAIGRMVVKGGESWVYFRMGEEAFALTPDASESMAEAMEGGVFSLEGAGENDFLKEAFREVASAVRRDNSGPATTQ